ncbi:MAG: hypothetical protein A2Y17_01660 [Clostridiales bacterium GWF2_38_85]|nr:MAG: hypothetical protein A2Y17_01660 [Clostridiales bacterium GWF2_38_85]HBL84784.1 hypothetical protein [Clostridiales bacterium]
MEEINILSLRQAKVFENSLYQSPECAVMRFYGDDTCIESEKEYSLPLKIKATAMTDSTNIRLFFNRGEVIFNWECNPCELRVHDIISGNAYGFENTGSVATNEFVDIIWIIGKDKTEIYVNDELRLISSDFEYISELKKFPSLKIRSTVKVASAWGSTVTLKSLEIDEL